MKYTDLLRNLQDLEPWQKRKEKDGSSGDMDLKETDKDKLYGS